MKNAFGYLVPITAKKRGRQTFTVEYVRAKNRRQADLKREAEALFITPAKQSTTT